MHRARFICIMLLAMVIVEGSFGQQCGLNEEFHSCGSPCEPTCEQPNPTVCPLSCVIGCQCKEGYLRNSASQCVQPAEC